MEVFESKMARMKEQMTLQCVKANLGRSGT
jgi:hypothetical protein